MYNTVMFHDLIKEEMADHIIDKISATIFVESQLGYIHGMTRDQSDVDVSKTSIKRLEDPSDQSRSQRLKEQNGSDVDHCGSQRLRHERLCDRRSVLQGRKRH